MKKLLQLLILFIFTQSNAQPIQYNWVQGIGGKNSYIGNAVMVKDTAGFLYVTGDFQGTQNFGTFTLTSSGFNDVYVAKFDTAGTCIWAKKGGSIFGSAYAGGIAVDGNANVYVTGYFTNTITFDFMSQNAVGSYDIFIAKLDYAGNAMWVNAAGGSASDYASSIFCDGSNIYLTGSFTNNANFGTFNLTTSSISDADIFLVSYDLAGTCVWAYKAGGTSDDKGLCIKKDYGGNIVLSGYFSGTATFGSNTAVSTAFGDVFLAKYNSTGSSNIWVISGGSEGGDNANSFGFDQLGNYYVTGDIGDTAVFGSFTILDNGYGNMFIAKANSSGVWQWAKSGGGSSNDAALDISVRPDGACYVTGYFSVTAFFSPLALTSSGLNDVFIVKYSPAGTVIFAVKIGGASYDLGKSIVDDENGTIYTTGEYSQSVTIGGTLLGTPTGTWNNYLVKMNGGTVGMDELNLQVNELNIFPNPVNEKLTILIPESIAGNFEVELLDADAKVVLKKSYPHKHTPSLIFDIGRQAPGNYFIRLKAGNSEFVSKIIVSKE